MKFRLMPIFALALIILANALVLQEEPDTCLMLIAENLGKGGANFYLYHLFSLNAVSIEKGDVFEYEIYLLDDLPEKKGGVDIWFAGGQPALRDVVYNGKRIKDQNGINAHGDGVLGPADGKWYQRSFPLDAAAGWTSRQWHLVSEGDRPGCYVQFVDNVRIRRASGEVIAIYENGDPPVNEPGIALGYSTYSSLQSVERSLVDSPAPGRTLKEEVAHIRARGRRITALADLKTEIEVVQAILESDMGPSPEGFEEEVASILENLDTALEDDERFQTLLARLQEVLSSAKPIMKKYTGHLVGHAHIDLQWLWEWPETVEVCRDTFGQAVRFMESYEGYTFTQSSTALYAATEEHFPQLFAKIKHYVAKGQWEIVGGRICEGDQHMISPESHARHFLYGQRYFRERFGRDARVGWEPDTFGHTAQMPQILKLGGCEAVYFCRGGDNVPLFWWEALDGTRILAFDETATGTWYNASVSRIQLKELSDFLKRYGSPDALLVYGVGNHGGGPTREHIESALDMQSRPHNPRLVFSTATAFFDAVRKKVDLEKIPSLKKELNNRSTGPFFGTYTSHGDVKRWNRDAESAAESAEVLATVASFHGFPYPGETFRKIWEDITWNQHHDTLSGTSINPSYAKSRSMYGKAIEKSRVIGNEALRHIAGIGSGTGSAEGKQALLVFNPLCWDRDSLVAFDLEHVPEPGKSLSAVGPDGRATPVQVINGEGGSQGLFLAKNLPSMGYASFLITSKETASSSPLRVTDSLLENDRLRLEIDPHSGKITSLHHKASGKEFLKPGGSARLEVRFERPHRMSAWVIGEFLPLREEPQKEKITVVERGPVRVTLRIDSDFGASAITQFISLVRESGLVEIQCEVDWKEKGSPDRPAPFLKAVVDTVLEEPSAYYEVPFGAVSRSAEGQEVPALKWADLGTAGMGLSLLNDCRHGYSAKGGILSLSLIRSSYAPDPAADVGFHRIGYAFYPHSGTWQEAATARRAAEFNKPVWVLDVPESSLKTLERKRSYFSHDSDSIMVTGLKRSEDDDAVVFRCYEAEGSEAVLKLRSFKPLSQVESVDFIEDPLEPVSISEGCLMDRLGPFKIATYKIKFKEAGYSPPLF